MSFESFDFSVFANVPGDLIEIGVMRGETSGVLAAGARSLGKQFHAVDGFCGMSTPTEEDYSDGKCRYPRGRFNDKTESLYRSNMKKYADILTVHAGFVPNILSSIDLDRICFAFVDLDHCNITRYALNWCLPRLALGGALYVHDYVPGNDYLATLGVDRFRESLVQPCSFDCFSNVRGHFAVFKKGDPIEWLERDRSEQKYFRGGERYSPHLYNGLLEMVQSLSFPMKNMVEIGCNAGDSTELFAMAFQEVYAVDPWAASYSSIGKLVSSSLEAEGVEDTFDTVAKRYPNITKIKAPSLNMVDRFEDGELDFVYVDGAHDYENAKKDIQAWLPKVRVGGMLGGHDYPMIKPVKKAVEDTIGKPDKVFVDGSWFVEVKK